jgi:hypothetical protein
VRIKEHRYSFKHKPTEKSKPAQYAYNKGHHVGWKEARVLETE